MKRQFLIATATAALLASTGFVLAQKADNAGPSSAAPSTSQATPGSSMPGAREKQGAGEKTTPGMSGSRAQTAPSPSGNKAAQSAPSGGEKMKGSVKGADSQMGQSGKNQAQAPAGSNPMHAQSQPSSTSTQSSQSSEKGTSTERNASTSQTETNVQLSNDQRTKIRETVIRQSNAPRLNRNKVNFSLNVGAVVPRSVHVAVLPETVIEIHPQWRGYRYVLVGDVVVILEPSTLRIVAIIPA